MEVEATMNYTRAVKKADGTVVWHFPGGCRVDECVLTPATGWDEIGRLAERAVLAGFGEDPVDLADWLLQVREDDRTIEIFPVPDWARDTG